MGVIGLLRDFKGLLVSSSDLWEPKGFNWIAMGFKGFQGFQMI